jgi:hypothetical protein
MKKTLVLFLLLFTSNIYADCIRGSLYVSFPNTDIIKKNSIFILDGNDAEISAVVKLSKKDNIYMISGKIKIKLSVTEICRGDESFSQAVLKPETELEFGREYVLTIDSLSSKNLSYQKKYRVGKERDLEKPLITSNPTLLEKSYHGTACGPIISVIFKSPAIEDSGIVLRTTVKSMKSGKETTYYIIPRDGKIEVGRGMCGGPFNFMDGDTFEATFSLMDDAGNTSAPTGEPISFTKPLLQN